MTTTETRSEGTYRRWLRQPRSAPPWPVTGRPSSVAAVQAEAIRRRRAVGEVSPVRTGGCTAHPRRRASRRCGAPRRSCRRGWRRARRRRSTGCGSPRRGSRRRTCLRSPRCRRAWPRVSAARNALAMPARSNTRVRSNSAKLRPVRCCTMSDRMRKFWLHVGMARAGREVQRACAGDHAGGLGVAERRLGRRAVQHRHRPVVAQAGLVVAQMQRRRRRLLQQRQAGAHIAIQHRRIGKRIQHHGAGELLGDGAHAEQRARRERDAPFGIRPAPGVAHQHLAVAQRGDRAAGSGIAAWQGFDDAIEAGGEGCVHLGCVMIACGPCAPPRRWWCARSCPRPSTRDSASRSQRMRCAWPVIHGCSVRLNDAPPSSCRNANASAMLSAHTGGGTRRSHMHSRSFHSGCGGSAIRPRSSRNGRSSFAQSVV